MKHNFPLSLLIGVAWFVFILLLVALFIVCIPFLLLLGVYFLLLEAVLHARLSWSGRSITWAEACAKLSTGRGTLILEVLPNGGEVERVWLMRERLGKLDPYAPWQEFAELDRQLRSDPLALSVDEGFTNWCSRTLPRLAPGLCLVSAIPGGTVRRCLDEAHLPERSVAVVLSPQLTTAVRRSFHRSQTAKE
jgi:hypothetical protein